MGAAVGDQLMADARLVDFGKLECAEIVAGPDRDKHALAALPAEFLDQLAGHDEGQPAAIALATFNADMQAAPGAEIAGAVMRDSGKEGHLRLHWWNGGNMKRAFYASSTKAYFCTRCCCCDVIYDPHSGGRNSMLRRIFGVLWLAVSLTGAVLPAESAHAASWGYKADEDAMTDKKVALLSAIEGGFNSAVLGLKCWEGSPPTLKLMVILPFNYDESASYKDVVEVTIRVDKEDPMNLLFKTQNMGGKLGFVNDLTDQNDAKTILDDFSASKKRVVIQVANQIRQFPVGNSAKSFGSFRKACGIPN